jgi:triacylglycerol lipase
MSVLGLIPSPTPTADHLDTGTELHFRVQDALASARRVWLRGRLLELADARPQSSRRPRWWKRWRGRSLPAVATPTLRIETQLGGKVFDVEVPVDADGQFEATWVTDLPPTRRGWRVARNRLTFAGKSGDACAVVLGPRPDAAGVVAVLLPAALTREAGGPQRLASSDFAVRLTPLLRRLQNGLEGACSIYYLACVPPDGEAHQAELALSATALGWPSGNFVLSPVPRERVAEAFHHSLDRLRWLFADSLDLRVLNLEPAAARTIASCTQPAKDRTVVRRLAQPTDDPWSLLGDARPAYPPTCLGGLRPSRSIRVSRYPIVFCHGMLGYTMLRMQLPDNCNCFMPLARFLRERGFRVLFPEVEPTGGVRERAQQLREQILSWTTEPINLLAHSMGGLDARYLVSNLNMGQRVRSLTTVCTPHRGSYLADWFLANYRNRVPLLLALEAFGVNLDGFRDCRPAVCREFNRTTPDVPGVQYFSYGGEVSPARVSPVLRRALNLLGAVEGPNDGMVSLASARWGKYLGTIHVDHFAQTPDSAFVRPGEDFDALGFYLRVVDDLVRRGF